MLGLLSDVLAEVGNARSREARRRAWRLEGFDNFRLSVAVLGTRASLGLSSVTKKYS